jgi:hypothetical protein
MGAGISKEIKGMINDGKINDVQPFRSDKTPFWEGRTR